MSTPDPVPLFNSALIDRMQERADALVETANRWILERPEIEDDDLATKLDAFLGQLEAEMKAAETQRVAEKEPHLTAGREIDAKWQALMRPLTLAKEVLRKRLMSYLLAKQQKIEDARREAEWRAQRLMEEADRKELDGTIQSIIERENLQIAAAFEKQAASTPARASVKSEYSARARTLRSFWSARISNIDAALSTYRDHPDVAETLTRLASAEARGGVRELSGFEIKEEMR